MTPQVWLLSSADARQQHCRARPVLSVDLAETCLRLALFPTGKLIVGDEQDTGVLGMADDTVEAIGHKRTVGPIDLAPAERDDDSVKRARMKPWTSPAERQVALPSGTT